MTIHSLAIHRVTVKKNTTTVGGGGGVIETPTTVKTNVKCRIQPLDSFQTAKFQKQGIRTTHRIYFPEDPKIDNRHFLEFKDSNGTTRTFIVTGSFNTDYLDRLFVVDAQERSDVDNV